MSSVYHATAEEGLRSLQVAPEPARESRARPFDAFLANESIGKRPNHVRDETLRAPRRDDADYAWAATPADTPTTRSVDRDARDKPAASGQAAEAEDVGTSEPRGATRNSEGEGNDDSHLASQAKPVLGETNVPSSLPDFEGATPDLVEQTAHQPGLAGEGTQVTTQVVVTGELTGEVSSSTPIQSKSGGLRHFEKAAGATADQQLVLAADSQADQPIEATLSAGALAQTADVRSQDVHANASGGSAARQDAASTAEPRGGRCNGDAAQVTANDLQANPAVGHATITASAPAIEVAVDVSVAETVTDEVASRVSDVAQQVSSTSASPGSDPRGDGRNPLSGRTAQGTAAGKSALGPADAHRFVSRVSRAVETAHQRGESLQIRLSPPELGSLRVEIAVRGGVLTAHLEAETQAARIALLDNLPALRERLAEQSVRVERFDVDVRDESGGRFHERAPSFEDHRRSMPQRTHRESQSLPGTVGPGRSGTRPALNHLGGGRINLVV